MVISHIFIFLTAHINICIDFILILNHTSLSSNYKTVIILIDYDI